jgi:AraC-like DNA-binding protein
LSQNGKIWYVLAVFVMNKRLESTKTKPVHPFLAASSWNRIVRSYRTACGLTPVLLQADGRRAWGTPGPLDALPLVIQARRHAIEESLRWGEPNIFLLAAGAISWAVALVDGQTLLGGACGGEVTCDDDPVDAAEVAQNLAGWSPARNRVRDHLQALPVWPQARVHSAAGLLAETVYAASAWKPDLWRKNHEDAVQQRQIAEAIHQGKLATSRNWPVAEERRLLLLLRAGDSNGARKHLNQLLASMFLDSPRQPVLQARVLELLGYLIRVAIEDSPELASLMTVHQHWVDQIIAARTFEGLSRVVRDALDAFMRAVAQQGLGRTNLHVRQALDYITENLTAPVSLTAAARVAGISRFRLAHLLKATTGQTLLQHVKRLRTEEARRRLETTTQSCAEIASALGFADQSHFTRHFREIAGITPAQYRRARRLQPA